MPDENIRHYLAVIEPIAGQMESGPEYAQLARAIEEWQSEAGVRFLMRGAWLVAQDIGEAELGRTLERLSGDGFWLTIPLPADGEIAGRTYQNI